MTAADRFSRSIEQQLVLASARSAAVDRGESVAFPDDFDWEAAHAFAHRHGLSPMFTQFIRGEAALNVPQHVRAECDARLRPFVTRSLVLTAELIRVARILRNEVAFRAEKGPVLAQRAYGTTGLRDFGDLDLYVRSSDVGRAGELLTAAGYEAKYSLSGAGLELHLASNCELEFIGREPPTTVDLHWGAVPPFLPYLIPPLAFERGASVRIGSDELPTFAPADAVIVLTLSAAKDLWWRLEPLLALSRFVTRSGVELDEVSSVASGVGCRALVRVTLRVADLHFGLESSRALRLSAHEEETADRLVRRAYASALQAVGIAEVVRELYGLSDRPSELVRSVVRAIFRPTVADVLAAGRDRGTPYLYVRRPLRLLLKLVRR